MATKRAGIKASHPPSQGIPSMIPGDGVTGGKREGRDPSWSPRHARGGSSALRRTMASACPARTRSSMMSREGQVRTVSPASESPFSAEHGERPCSRERDITVSTPSTSRLVSHGLRSYSLVHRMGRPIPTTDLAHASTPRPQCSTVRGQVANRSNNACCCEQTDWRSGSSPLLAANLPAWLQRARAAVRPPAVVPRKRPKYEVGRSVGHRAGG
jgi:hypothetical protein